jgi:hypothetical protein
MSKRKPGITTDVRYVDDETVSVTHMGFAEELIASRIATAEMLAIPKPRNDQHGVPYSINRYYAIVDGQPVRRYRIRRTIPYAAAMQMQGMPWAVAKWREMRRQRDERDAGREASGDVVPTPEPKKRPQLRVVVDNTRR